MTPLEEKITETAETFKNQKIMEGLPRSAVRNILESIATQAVEEYKKELLEKLPEIVEQDDTDFQCDYDDQMDAYEQKGYNEAITDVKSLINKSN